MYCIVHVRLTVYCTLFSTHCTVRVRVQWYARAGLLDGESQLIDADRGFTRHQIDEPGQGIVVKLGMPAIINTVRCYTSIVILLLYELLYNILNEHWELFARLWW